MCEFLYRAPDHNSNSHPQHVILIPSALQDQVLKSLHEGPLGGHLGITRTEERVRKRFHWPGIRKNSNQTYSVVQCLKSQEFTY